MGFTDYKFTDFCVHTKDLKTRLSLKKSYFRVFDFCCDLQVVVLLPITTLT